MAENRKDAVDTIVAHFFRYLLVFGLTKHSYNSKTHRLEHSLGRHCFSLALHLTIAAKHLQSVVKAVMLDPVDSSSREFYRNLNSLMYFSQFFTIILSIGLQWTLRANVSNLFNEALQIWQQDIAHLVNSKEIRRKVVWRFFVIALITGLFAASKVPDMYLSNTRLTRLLFYYISNQFLEATLLLFFSSLVFMHYLFEVLNYNLARVVNEIASLQSAHGGMAAILEVELSEIGRIHTKLQKWVTRFKDLYQADLLIYLLSFGADFINILFRLVIAIHTRRFLRFPVAFIYTVSVLVLVQIQLIYQLHIAGGMLRASAEAGQIMKDLPTHGLPSIELERCIDMMSFQFEYDKLALSICGLFDLGWDNSFYVAEAILMYLLILVQWDYYEFISK